MTVAAYNTDLQLVDDCADTSGWSEMTGRTSGGAATAEDRAYIEGSGAVSQSTGAASGRTVGLQYDYGGNISGWTSGWVILMWQYWQAPKAIGTWADGGMRIAIGSSAGNVKLWNAQGNDYGRNPYGGWGNTAIDPTFAYDEVIGNPVDGNYRIFCSAPYLLQTVSKGNPHCVDVIRYGRGQLKVEYGDGSGYGTFSGMATANDADSARWGLFSLQQGVYLYKGLMSLGTSSNAVDFRDANKAIIIDACPRTYASFNKIEIVNGSSRVDWTNISFQALGALAKGQLEVVDNCDVNLDGCTFIAMDTFIFKASSDVLNSVFLTCGQVTANGAKFNGTKFLGYTGAADSSQLIWDTNVDTDGKLDGCTFQKGTNATHAFTLGTNSPDTVSIRGCTFSGYNASNGENDSTIYVAKTGGTVTIYTYACSGNITYKSAGATVTIVPDSLTLKMVVTDVNGDPVESAFAYIDNDDQSPYIMNTTTSDQGIATTGYTGGTVAGTRWRVRKYGYKQFKQIVDIGTENITLPVTLFPDPQQT